MLDFTEKKNLIKNSITIKQVIDRYAPREVSHNGFCLCPIHGEKTPSCKINIDNNTFFCFGCGAKGDIISFVENVLNIDFVQAINILGNDFNLDFDGEPLSEEEFMAKCEAERQEEIKKNKELKRKEFILQENEKISKLLLTLRKRCVILYSKPMISEYEMNDYLKSKERIKRLEDIYLTLNNLCQGEPQLSQSNLIEKLRLGVIEL